MNGVSRYDGETFTTFNVNDGLAGNTVFAIHGGERIGTKMVKSHKTR